MKRVIIASAEIKPWSASEEKRSRAISDKINSMLFAGDEFEEFYETDGDDNPVATFNLSIPGRADTEISIYREYLVYAQNWDENDIRVKQGKRVPGTTYFSVADNGDVIDENFVGYATKEDAIHAAEIYMDELRRRFEKYNH